MNKPKIEAGAAHFSADLSGGTITVRHGTTNEILRQIKNAEAGSWDKIWNAIRAIKSVKKG
jgi:hypothetical protein